jgi:DNA polymerase-3 subunit epsilon
MRVATPIVFFDIETTGLNPKRHSIIQIGAVALDEGLREIATFEVKVGFALKRRAENPVSRLNSYDESTWQKEALPEREAARRFAAFLKDHASLPRKTKNGKPFFVAQLAAYNAPFDAVFLQTWYERLREFLPAARPPLCVMQRAQWYFEESLKRKPNDWKLSTVAKHCGIPLTNAHDALADARATAGVYREIYFAMKRGVVLSRRHARNSSTTLRRALSTR